MTATRPTDWTALDQAKDPVPGDPDVIESEAAAYRLTAKAVEEGAERVARIAYSSDSEAIGVVREHATAIAHELEAARGRVQGTADALTAYLPELRSAQSASLAALSEANEARQYKQQASAEMVNAATDFSGLTDQARREQLVEVFNRAKTKRDAAQERIDDARARLQVAIKIRDDAAKQAIARLDTADEQSTVKDSTWEKIQAALKEVSEYLDIFKDAIDKGRALLGAITVVCYRACPAAVPYLKAFDVVLGAVSLGLGALSDGCKVASGEMTVGQACADLFIDGAFLAWSAATVTGPVSGGPLAVGFNKLVRGSIKSSLEMGYDFAFEPKDLEGETFVSRQVEDSWVYKSGEALTEAWQGATTLVSQAGSVASSLLAGASR